MHTHPPMDGVSIEPCPEALADLAAILAGEWAVYLRLGPEGAVLSVKSSEAYAFGESSGTKWYGMTPEQRARVVLGWIEKAAAYCRNPKTRWAPPA